MFFREKPLAGIISVFVLLWAALCVSLPAFALDVPQLQGRVNDYANLLSPATKGQLESVLKTLESTDSTQIVVLTVKSLEGDSLEDFSLRVVEQWKIGQQELDNGALLLVAKDDRKIRIEVGYGLEGTLTDLAAGRIIRNVIAPRFQQGNFDQGIIDGVGAIVGTVRGTFNAADAPRKTSSSTPDLGGLMTMMIFFFFFFGSLFRRSKIASTIAGGVVSPILGFLFFGLTGIALLVLVPIGAIGGFAASALASSAGGAVSSGRGGIFPGGFRHSSGGFGGGGFGGGFGGGGGGFGGGGASGGW